MVTSRLLWRGTARLWTSPNSSRKPSANTTCSPTPPSHLKRTHKTNTRRWTDTRPRITHTPTVTHTPGRSRTAAALTSTTRGRRSARNTSARRKAVSWRRLPRNPTGMERQIGCQTTGSLYYRSCFYTQTDCCCPDRPFVIGQRGEVISLHCCQAVEWHEIFFKIFMDPISN